MKKSLIFLFSIFTLSVIAQNTVGLLSYEPSKTYDGYNLMFPHNQPNVYLLNNCGEIVHIWEDEPDFRPGNSAYLMENGDLIKCKRPASVAGNPIWAGGGGGIVEIRDWDNTLTFQFIMNDSLERLHHDIAPMSNGNILMIAWELKTNEEAIQAGRDPASLTEEVLWPDKIIEVNPAGEIVWEWHAWDHLVQDFDETKDNYGIVENSPQKIDVNWDTSDGAADWMHANAIDYNEELDQIILCVPTFHEFWVIDHSTSTEQAAGSFGGLGGRGGDLLYRWGNPATYRAGTAADQKLFYPHDPHWVDRFLDFSHPDFGKIVVFNNRVGPDFSTVNVIDNIFDMYSWEYPLIGGNSWEPTGFAQTIVHPVDSSLLFSTGLSSVQLLPNENTLICVGRFGYSFELTPENEIVWEYKTPLNGGAAASQGDTLAINNNLTFRLNRYPVDFPAFDGRDLVSLGYIEENPDTNFCAEIISSVEEPDFYELRLFPNPAQTQLTLDWQGNNTVIIQVFDLLGRQIERYAGFGGRKELDISNWQEGIYFVRIDQSKARKIVVSR